MKLAVALIVTTLMLEFGVAHTITRYNWGEHVKLNAGYFSEKVQGAVQNGYVMDKFCKIIEVRYK